MLEDKAENTASVGPDWEGAWGVGIQIKTEVCPVDTTVTTTMLNAEGLQNQEAQ